MFDAYLAQDRDAAERLIADEFVFTSPQDHHLGREAFFGRCFPTADRLKFQEILELVSAGEAAVFVLYEHKLKAGGRYRNTEYITLWDGQLIEVFFGGPVTQNRPGRLVDLRLELVLVPVSDQDRAKAFYTEGRIQPGRRPPSRRLSGRAGHASRFSVLSYAHEKPGDCGLGEGLHLVVSDIDAARSALVEGGIGVSELFHFEDGRQLVGPDAKRADHNTFWTFSDPDGNGWMLQEVGRAEPPH